MIDPIISEKIKAKLIEIEQTFNIDIIYACESGSRSWGFASKDSDYDVRFIYVHKPEHYLMISHDRSEEPRNPDTGGFLENSESINLPIVDDLDFAGWDIKKMLGLLYKTNPPLSEWLASPHVYRETPVVEQIRELSIKYHSKTSAMYHYHHMANKHFEEYIKGRDFVERKKYLYVLRPILAICHLEGSSGPAPMEIERVLHFLPSDIRPAVDQLLHEKRTGVELGKGLPDKVLNAYLESALKEHKTKIQSRESVYFKPHDLNAFYYNFIKGRM